MTRLLPTLVAVTLIVALAAGVVSGAGAMLDMYPGDSIQTTIGGAVDGDIYVPAGTYAENLDVNKSITPIADGADVVTLRAAASNPSAEYVQSSTHINFGEMVSGSIDYSTEIDTYTFSAYASDTVVIRIDGPSGSYNLNPEIRLYAPNGTLLMSQWNYNNLEMLHTLPDNGEYNIMLCDHHIEYTGNYSLFIQRINNPSNATPIGFGEMVSGSIDYYRD